MISQIWFGSSEMRWQDRMTEIVDDHRFDAICSETWNSIERQFRDEFPGDYEMHFEIKDGIHIELIFGDEKDELFWILKYS